MEKWASKIKTRERPHANVGRLKHTHEKYGKIYQFLLDPRELLKISTVARRDRPGQEYYQRKLKGKKLKQIKKFYKQKNLPPNNIIIGCDEENWTGKEFSPVDLSALTHFLNMEKEKVPMKMKVDFGVLTFPREYRSCWIIDGQHRLYGMAKLLDKDLADTKLPIIAFANMTQIQQGTDVSGHQHNTNTNLWRSKIRPLGRLRGLYQRTWHCIKHSKRSRKHQEH